MLNELTVQVEQELAAIAAAPPVPSAGLVQRCHFCGQLAAATSLVETVDGQERFKGVCCGG
jgi:hypothetical protein